MVETSRIASASSLVPSSAVAVFGGRWRAAAWRAGAVRECGRALRGRACVSVPPPRTLAFDRSTRGLEPPHGPSRCRFLHAIAHLMTKHGNGFQNQFHRRAPMFFGAPLGMNRLADWAEACEPLYRLYVPRLRGSGCGVRGDAAARKTQHIACKVQGLSHTCLRMTRRISLAERADRGGAPTPPKYPRLLRPAR